MQRRKTLVNGLLNAGIVQNKEQIHNILEKLNLDTFEDFVNYGDLSLSQLKAMKVVRMLSDEQLEGFCQLVNPQKDPDGRP